jgi:hypothetical protein
LVAHCKTWYPNYLSCFTRSSLFGEKLLFAIDLSIQMHLELLSDDKPINEIDMFRIEREMEDFKGKIQQQNFDAYLPSSVYQAQIENGKRTPRATEPVTGTTTIDPSEHRATTTHPGSKS